MRLPMTVKKTAAKKTALPKNTMKDAIVRHLHCSLGTDENKANNHAWWKATCASVQEHVLEQLRKTQKSHYFSRVFNGTFNVKQPA